jgi:hypothetical protein
LAGATAPAPRVHSSTSLRSSCALRLRLRVIGAPQASLVDDAADRP